MSEPIIHIPGQPRISASLSEDDVLWRYIDAAKFLDFVHNRTLFFTRGDQFEDKFEGSFTDSLRDAINEAYRTAGIEFGFDEFRQRLRERVFVNCWHRSGDDSMAMWKIYGQSSCAVALTTTVGKLRDSLKNQDLPFEMSIEQVQYVKHWRDPALDIAPYSRVFAYKVKAFEYEKEVRVVIDRFATEFNTSIFEAGMPIKISPETLLRSIVVAPESPEWFETLVRDVSQEYGITAPVRRSLLSKEPV